MLDFNSMFIKSWLLQNAGTEFGKTVLEHKDEVLYGNMAVAKFLAENYSEYHYTVPFVSC